MDDEGALGHVGLVRCECSKKWSLVKKCKSKRYESEFISLIL